MSPKKPDEPARKLLVVFQRVFEYLPIATEVQVVSFLAKVVFPANDDGCWLWSGATDGRGYGQMFSSRHRHRAAHRFCYELLVGSIAAGYHLHHACTTPSCVNPDHLQPVAPDAHARELTPLNITAANTRKTQCPQGHPFKWVKRSGRTRRYCPTCSRASSQRIKRRYREAHPIPPVTHCYRGHEYTAENTYTDKKGKRSCKICRADNAKRFYGRHPEQKPKGRGHQRDWEACSKGHPFTEENTYHAPNGTRACRACRAETQRAHWHKKHPDAPFQPQKGPRKK